MTALTAAQLIALALVWIALLIVVAISCINGACEEPITQDELSQMLSTENQKHQRPRLRAGAIQEIKNGN